MFLELMNTQYPVQLCWQLVSPPNEMLSAMNLALSKQLQPKASRPAVPGPMPQLGIFGTPSAARSTWTQASRTLTTPLLSCKFSPTAIEQASWLPVGLKSELERWKAPYELWARRSPHWDSKTHACSPPENSIYASPDNSRPTKRKTCLHAASSPSRFPCSPKPSHSAI
jgi:hypothetical protein